MSSTATDTTIFSDLLQEIGVRHTAPYSDRRFRQLSFPTLFGLTKLMQEYGIESQGMRIADKTEICRATPPFIASTSAGFVIVTSVDADSIGYMSQGIKESAPLDDFLRAFDGNLLLAYPFPEACEPSYGRHHALEIATKAKRVCLWIAAAFLFLYLFIGNRIYAHASTVILTLLDLGGLYISYLLVQKSLNIHNPAADKVCGVIQNGGCDSVLATSAAKFFGLFGWSEVGFGYFSVSLMTLLVFPQWIGYLALCNVCCLPFSFWSVWYQKYRARHWCTLCLSVQLTLWLLFFAYLGGGWFHGLFPLRIELLVLIASYGAVLLGLNAILPKFDNTPADDNENS